MQQIDLNADIGEGFAFDEALLAHLSSANIACGLHAGDALAMTRAVRWAKQNQVRIGAHPSFPDRENFGRSNMQLSPEALRAYLLYQLGALQSICEAEGVAISYVKPHGALYNMAAKDADLALQIVETIKSVNPQLKLMGLAGSQMLQVAQAHGLETIAEVFADRHYMPDGSLVPRSHPQAMVESDDAAIAQVLQMLQQGEVTAIDGSKVKVAPQSICLHGDNQQALQFAQRIAAELTKNAIRIQA